MPLLRLIYFCMKQASREGIRGDGDPLDICVLAEKSITHGDILLPVTPVGGVYCTDSFAAALLVSKCDNCRFTSVGKQDLAKNYGKVELYKLERI